MKGKSDLLSFVPCAMQFHMAVQPTHQVVSFPDFIWIQDNFMKPSNFKSVFCVALMNLPQEWVAHFSQKCGLLGPLGDDENVLTLLSSQAHCVLCANLDLLVCWQGPLQMSIWIIFRKGADGTRAAGWGILMVWCIGVCQGRENEDGRGEDEDGGWNSEWCWGWGGPDKDIMKNKRAC